MIRLRHCPECRRETYQTREPSEPGEPPVWTCRPCMNEPEPVPGAARERGELDGMETIEDQPASWNALFSKRRP